MDASRYFTAMHNAMSAQHPRAQLLLTVKLQDTCGNDACLELKQLPGENTSILCYSTMGRRCLNFQLFRKGWQLCHNADGQLVGRFPSSADGLIDETDFRAYCREDRLDLARTQRILSELRTLAGADHQGSIPQNARTGAARGRCPLDLLESGPCTQSAAERHPLLAGRFSGRKRAPRLAGRPAGRAPCGPVAGQRYRRILPSIGADDRHGPCRFRRSCSSQPQPFGSHFPRPEQKLAEHSGCDGKHVNLSLQSKGLPHVIWCSSPLLFF